MLEVESLVSQPRLAGASFNVSAGEIVGLAGLVGSGRTEVLKAVFGALPVHDGTVRIAGKALVAPSPLATIKQGVAFIPEDRQEESIFADHSVLTNICIAAANSSTGENLSGRFMLDGRKMAAVAGRLKDTLQIKTQSVHSPISSLSGGNQQKVILARWIATKPKIVLADEPTRGVSIGSKIEIYRLIRELAANDAAVLLVSSEFEELVGLCDRIVIMANGRTVDELSPDGLQADDLLQLVLSRSTSAAGGNSAGEHNPRTAPEAAL